VYLLVQLGVVAILQVRIDWRERAGCTKGHFILIVQHYMRIDGVYKDTFKRSINNIISRIKVSFGSTRCASELTHP
jgi:hypothetical protein